jgi:hypothetical protein
LPVHSRQPAKKYMILAAGARKFQVFAAATTATRNLSTIVWLRKPANHSYELKRRVARLWRSKHQVRTNGGFEVMNFRRDIV